MPYAENLQFYVLLEGIALRIADNLLALPLAESPTQPNGCKAGWFQAASPLPK
jgi:hypothetical protein